MRWFSVADVEARARQRLATAHYDFFAGGAGAEWTVRANEAAFARLSLLPRVLRGNAKRDLAVSLFDRPLSMPILVAPTAFHRLAHPEGEAATARAAAAAGTVMIVSMASTLPVEAVADAARDGAPAGDPTLWFQLYLQPDLAFTESLIRRVEAAGYRALVVTVDSPVLGWRERDHRNGFLDLPAGLACENLRDGDGVRDIVMAPELTWEHVDWLRGITRLPVLLKGVLHPQDARLAVRHGAHGLIVSNHGGRQLDGAAATIDALPGVVAAVAGRIPVLLDGGVRHGADVLRALAYGARAVGIGRPVLWGLAADGAAGVRAVLELLRDDFDRALALCGGSSPRDVDADLLAAASPLAAAPEVR